MEEEFINLCKENQIKKARRFFNKYHGTDNQIEIETIADLFIEYCMKCEIGINRMLFNISLSTNQALYIYTNFIDLFEKCYSNHDFLIAEWIYYIGKIYNIDYNINKQKEKILDVTNINYQIRLNFLDSLC